MFHIFSRVIFLLIMDIPWGSSLFMFMDAPLLVLLGIRLEFHLLLPVWLVNTSVLQLRRSWLLQCSCTETVWSSKFELATLIRHLSYCQLLFYAMLVYLASQQVNIKAGITQIIKNWLFVKLYVGKKVCPCFDPKSWHYEFVFIFFKESIISLQL